MIKEITNKLESQNISESTDLPQAAVLIGMLNANNPNEDTEIIYTLRSSKLSTHSGEVSFPGGKRDEIDASLEKTALREANEEIGLNANDAKFLGRLDYLVSRHNIEVNPIIFSINKEPQFVPNEEIEAVFTVPISFLINKKNLQKDIVEKHGKRWFVPQWQYKNFKIWGLTAMITTNFLNICFNTNIGVEEG
mgnify:FL=1